ncbi:helix-turn-helix transcriptional regulator [Yersinia ruckeri]
MFMTGYELRLWRKGMGWDQERAAEELGKCLRTYKAYEKSPAIDRVVELATRALTLTSLLPALSGKNSAEICGVLDTLVD